MSRAPAAWQRNLEKIVRGGALWEPDEEHQAVWAEVSPKALALPETRDQVCELVRLARGERLNVLPFGRGTKLRMGGAGPPIDLAISLERLNRVRDYPASDLTISVEPGLPVRELAATLAAQGQMLPLDVPFFGAATVGGTIAANINGPRRLAYGTWRDIVLGVEFVTAEGKLAKGGGKVVKNVAGYDTPKLMIGSLGTLGIMTELTFKVFPSPPATATFVMQFASAEAASQAVLRILNSPLIPQALDLVDEAAGAVIGAVGGSVTESVTGIKSLTGAPFTLLAGTAGPEPVLARFERELPELARSFARLPARPPTEQRGLENFECLRGASETALWMAVREAIPLLLRANPGGIIVKTSVPLARLGDYLTQCRRQSKDAGVGSAVLAHAGSGIVHTHLYALNSSADRAAPESIDSAAVFNAAVAAIREAEQLGGRAAAEWCPAGWKRTMELWGTLGDDFAWMRKLKAALDPRNTLSPGRFYGGI